MPSYRKLNGNWPRKHQKIHNKVYRRISGRKTNSKNNNNLERAAINKKEAKYIIQNIKYQLGVSFFKNDERERRK